MKIRKIKMIFPKNKKVQMKVNHEVSQISQVLLKLKKLKIQNESASKPLKVQLSKFQIKVIKR